MSLSISLLRVERMRRLILVDQSAEIYMRITLSGRKSGMAEHLLNGPEIGPGGEQMGGEAVPKPMR